MKRAWQARVKVRCTQCKDETQGKRNNAGISVGECACFLIALVRGVGISRRGNEVKDTENTSRPKRDMRNEKRLLVVGKSKQDDG